MHTRTRPVVFTDLDGTLLDHDTYSWQAARPALTRLRELDIPVVLTSSKTGVEIREIQHDMGLSTAPAIVENGAGTIGLPSADASSTGTYTRLRESLARLPDALRTPFEGFGDMDNARVSACTGLPPRAAELARQREYTEPGLWSGDKAGQQAFIDALGSLGISARHGGRFLTLSFGRTKADAMTEVINALQADFAIALGDAPNDAEMLETADIGVIIANPHRAPLPILGGEAEGRIRRSVQTGPHGWNTEMLDVLSSLDVPTH